MTPDPEILCHPNIPKPLHGINPRTIFGKDWWDAQRQIAYASTDYHCAACGVHKNEALFHKWLEAHEYYLFDYPKGRVTFDHLVPLCHACHNFIHDGRMRVLLERGEIDEAKYHKIIAHGMNIVRRANLLKKYEKRHTAKSFAKWADWRMVVDGKEYGPSSQSPYEWISGAWKKWRPNE